MKIALIGAPGSEKSKYARRIANRLNKESKTWKVIDGYVDHLRDSTGNPYGLDADYLANFEIAFTRRILEDEARHKGQNTITCGTIYETVVYGGIYSLGIPHIENEQTKVSQTLVAQLCMGTLGVLETQYFDYDAMFYLPLENEERTWEHAIDAKIPEVLEGFFKQTVVLEGTDRQKVNVATQIIEEISAVYTASADK